MDTSVLVAAVRSAKGASRELLRMVLDGEFKPLISVSLVLEYEAVLTRPEHLVVDAFDDRAQHMLEQLEVEQQASFVQRGPSQGYLDLSLIHIYPMTHALGKPFFASII